MRVMLCTLGCVVAAAVAAGVADATQQVREVDRALSAISEQTLRAHLRFLAHDELEGRRPGTRGGRTAEAYIAAQFEAAGLEPGGANGTYLQPVPLVGLTSEPSLVLGANRQTIALAYGEEFVAWPETPDEIVAADGELMFVGHGITAPEWGWDDYGGELLTDRVALIMVNDPGLTDSAVFNGAALTYYGRWTYKLEQAARMGAVGAILLHTAESATYPWQVVRSSWMGERIQLADRGTSSLRFAAWLSADAAQRVFAAAGRDLDVMVRRARRRDFRPMTTGINVAIHIRSDVRRFEAANVIGMIPGRDSVRRREAVVFTAHHDHLGIGTAVAGDSIYNGAEDNASGVAVLLTVAAALRQARMPLRSLVFVATTAEESGLLGAERYVAHPTVPLATTAAVINIDGANLRGRTRDMPALGAERSTLGDVLHAAAQAESLSVSPDPNPGAGSFFRSDHFAFARAGVPVLSMRIGADFAGRPPGWGAAQAAEYTRERYHQPGDEFDPSTSLAGALQQARVIVRMALRLAEASEFPTWNQDSEFRDAGTRLRAGLMRR